MNIQRNRQLFERAHCINIDTEVHRFWFRCDIISSCIFRSAKYSIFDELCSLFIHWNDSAITFDLIWINYPIKSINYRDHRSSWSLSSIKEMQLQTNIRIRNVVVNVQSKTITFFAMAVRIIYFYSGFLMLFFGDRFLFFRNHFSKLRSRVLKNGPLILFKCHFLK